MHQLQMNLEGGIAQEPAELGLGGDFGGHQVEEQYFQGPDILGNGPVLGHDKYVFLLQNSGCRQIVGNANWHRSPPVYFFLFVSIPYSKQKIQ